MTPKNCRRCFGDGDVFIDWIAIFCDIWNKKRVARTGDVVFLYSAFRLSVPQIGNIKIKIVVKNIYNHK